MSAPLLAIVADAGPLIALDNIDLLVRLEPLFQALVIPPAVAREVSPTVQLPDWITVQNLRKQPDRRLITSTLDEGEIEAISLALELPTYELLIDELAGRKRAIDLGINVTGTFGLLLVAKQLGVIERVQPELQKLTETRFYASSALVNRILTLAGEPPQ